MRINKTDKIDFEKPKDFNMKFIEEDLKFNVYKIRYKYKTNRGNLSENYKYAIAEDQTEVRFKFIEYINNFNRQKPYRSISNVKILDVELLGTVTK